MLTLTSDQRRASWNKTPVLSLTLAKVRLIIRLELGLTGQRQAMEWELGEQFGNMSIKSLRCVQSSAFSRGKDQRRHLLPDLTSLRSFTDTQGNKTLLAGSGFLQGCEETHACSHSLSCRTQPTEPPGVASHGHHTLTHAPWKHKVCFEPAEIVR